MNSSSQKPLIVGLALAVVLGLGIWYWSSMSTAAPVLTGNETATTSDISAAQKPDASAPGGIPTVTIKAVLKANTDPKIGAYLTTPTGATLYSYAKDTKGVSTCSGTCAASWRPYIVAATPALAVPLNVPGTVGVFVRADGRRQLTYEGKPLYTWKNDVKVGEITGDGVGGVWAVVKP